MKTLSFCTWAFLLLSLIVLNSCGKENVCVAGLGDCKNAATPIPKDTQSSGDFKLTVDAPKIKVNEKATFKASGGKKPYTFGIYRGLGTVDKSTQTEDSIVFTAPNVADYSVVEVYDADKTNLKLGIQIE